MSRFKRLVVPHCPHHITNRGNRRQPIFFSDDDKEFYLGLLRDYGARYGLKFWAYCLMSNHIHLVAVPENEFSMHLTIREVHRKYSLFINLRMNWQGSLWQKRYYSFPIEDIRLPRTIRYVENNPVRAGLAKEAERYPWSSARAHIFGTPDPLLSSNGAGLRLKNWESFLRKNEKEDVLNEIRSRSLTGRPFGGDTFIAQLENLLDRNISPKSPGRKKKSTIIEELSGKIDCK